MTQEQAAQIIGVRRPTISQWERGSSSPPKTKIARIAAAYGCTVEDLIGNEASA